MKSRYYKIKEFLNNKSNMIFFVILISVFFFYDYNHIISKAPQSTHHWRQADCISFTLNLAQGDGDFFHPQVHHLSSDNNTTGSGASEAPILYYFVAQLYNIFGYNIAIYRIVNTFIFFTGVFYLFKLLKILFKNSFWAYVIPLIIFVSPVVAFYASNFLTDTTAFAISLIAWYYFFKFKEKKKDKFLHTSFLFFTISGLLKILYLTSFVAIGVVFIIELFTNFKFNKSNKIFYKTYKHIFPFIFLLLIIVAWYLYVLYYNNLHHTLYFSNKTLPIWSLSSEKIISIFTYVKGFHFKEYFHFSFFILTSVIFIFNMFFFKKTNPFLFAITILLFISNIAILSLWFEAFRNHDYYFISLIVFPLFNFITFIDILKNINLNKYVSIFAKIIFSGYLIFLFHDADYKLFVRYYGWKNDHMKLDAAYGEINPYLKSIGIKRTDKIISIGDITNSYSLTMMNLKGWTQMAGQNASINSINSNIRNGAKYLFLKEDKYLLEEYLQPFINKKIGSYRNISIFSLEDIVINKDSKN